MAPDLNSLPPSRSASGSNSPLQLRPAQNSTETPRGSSSPHSPLAAAASMNAAGLSQDSRRSSRRRSSLMTNLNLNDPMPVPLSTDSQAQSISGTASLSRSPIPMATADPHHHRAPSLGELHQELEAEQEAQVNRLLSMIRQQQAQLETLQRPNHSTSTTTGGATAIEDSTPTSERSFSIPSLPPSSQPQATPISNQRPASPRHRTSHEYRRPSLSRQSSRRSHASASGGSRTGSPALRPLSAGLRQHESGGEGGDFNIPGGSRAGERERERDESAFYQAETQMLTRENQMLKQRIRELERQITDMNVSGSTPHSPARRSSLSAPPLDANTISGTSAAAKTAEGDGEIKEE
ncbi:hypothetical protein EV356DRAFT_579556 [Viridothelium virens]|uniref:Uncharacterized protein n=1 Tax=Viridothelium virens TaxID=1048519 RepID=A0A6A6GZA5_VIRVR|nr:hypothetical protein EV356DRAFT_579556 [Viridothelium virens]